MSKFLNYVLTHFRFKVSHPEETHDRGWEIRWTFFNVAFLKAGIPAKVINTIPLKYKEENLESFVCLANDIDLWFGWEKDGKYIFVEISEEDMDSLLTIGNYVAKVIDSPEEGWVYGKDKAWGIASKDGDGFKIFKQKGILPEEYRLPQRTLTWK